MATESFRQILDQAVCEKTTCQITLQLTDEADVALTGSQVASCTLTLYDRATAEILNSRNQQNIQNANGGTISAGGLLTLVLSNLDNVLVSQGRSKEDHVALIEYTWASGVRFGKKELTFVVVNQAKVT